METQTKNEIFVKYWSLYLHNTDCYAVRLNTTENPLFSYLKYEKIKRKAQIMYKFILGCFASRGMRQTFSCLSKLGGTTNLTRFLFGHIK